MEYVFLYRLDANKLRIYGATSGTLHNRRWSLPNALPAVARRDVMSLSAERVLDKKLPWLVAELVNGFQSAIIAGRDIGWHTGRQKNRPCQFFSGCNYNHCIHECSA